jgi:alpha-glucosidase
LYVDDGESLEPSEALDITFTVLKGQLKVDVQGDYRDSNALGNVTVLGVSGGVGQVKLNGITIDADKVNYDSDTSALKLSGLNNLTSSGAWKSSWTLSWV